MSEPQHYLQRSQFSKETSEQMQLFDTRTAPNANWPTPSQSAAARYWIPVIKSNMRSIRGDR